jgi:nucleoid-associated protein YgaU
LRGYGKWAKTQLVEHLKSRIEKVKAFAETYNKDLSNFKVTCVLSVMPNENTADEWIGEIDKLICFGANCIFIKPFLKPSEAATQARQFASNVFPSFR